MSDNAQLRRLPAVHEVVDRLESELGAVPRPLLIEEVRRAIGEAREDLRHGIEPRGEGIEERVRQRLEALSAPSQRRVINATGVILHTNLGRAPLTEFTPNFGYSNLEYDLGTGRRGKRDVHAAPLLERLLGRPGIAVNNNAAAIYLALNELAAGGEVLISRGELIEIGDGFRIPDIMLRSGAVLREVGTTNRTRIDDYRSAFSERTRLILRVHPSNFRIEGFTAKPELQELTALGRELAIPVYEDLGSGCPIDLRPYGVNEPVAADSLRDGADLISFSGDKLLGGPQAGILAGRADLVNRLRRNPMFRALRLDKLIYQALEATLRRLLLEQWDEIPVLRMIRQPAEQIRARAEALLGATPALRAEIVAGESVLGGGSTPAQTIPTWLIAVGGDRVAAMEKRLRSGEPPVIARIERDRLLIDLRTVAAAEEGELREALQTLS